MVEKTTVSYSVECDWCGLRKEGKLEDNGFAEIKIDDEEYRQKRKGGIAEDFATWFGSAIYKKRVLCPSCYEGVRVCLMQKEREIRQNVRRD